MTLKMILSLGFAFEEDVDLSTVWIRRKRDNQKIHVQEFLSYVLSLSVLF